MDGSSPRFGEDRLQGRSLFPGAGQALTRLAASLGLCAQQPVMVEWCARLRARGRRLESGPGPGQAVHAASYPRQRRLVLDTALRRCPRERNRIFVHEAFHFVWPRLANTERWSWEDLLRSELRMGVAGELGWSAEWRKDALRGADLRNRTRRWREYACESFCDTAAWLWAGVENHDEFTLEAAARTARRAWLDDLRRHHPAGLRI